MTIPDKRAEIAREQEYFDNAAKHRRRHHANLTAAPAAAVHHWAAALIKKYVRRQLNAESEAEAVAFGRIDDDQEKLYIGRSLIHDDQGEILVVSWKAPAADRYYTASAADPQGLLLRRSFECEENTILDFTDVRFADETVDEFLLRELARARTGTLRDIVATIRAAQFEVIRQSPDQVLVLEGGPGTGKTVIALHRVSWLLHRRPEMATGGVLVVGPNPTFLRYISEVLPGLGDDGVELRSLRELGPSVSIGRTEAEEVARLKGDARMAGLLARALEARIGEPEPVERLLTDRGFLAVPGTDIAAALAEARALRLPYAERRTAFRDRLVSLVARRAGNQTVRPAALANLLDRLWPQQTSTAFLHALLGSRRRLAAAASPDLTEAEANLLFRRGADRLSEEVWSEADVALLDELEDLIVGTQARYSHVVVDEVQDLSPMQLRSVARRSAKGSMTVVGDIAQSTGLWARDSWDAVTAHLPGPANVQMLAYSYRVPRQVYDFAARLLPVAAPTVAPPSVVRDGPAEPRVHRVPMAERARRTVSVALEHAAANRLVGIVCPEQCRREVEAELQDQGQTWTSGERHEPGSRLYLVSPVEAKGLEFDAVVVVEPERIVAEHVRGHRMLYVALTRTTAYLDVVCVGDPLPLSQPAPVETAQPVPAENFGARERDRLAELIASQVRNSAPREAWSAVLEEARRRLMGPAS
ncbi:MAG: AAA family ATPase [Micromonosporaceae bacterium]|nr:AAA family ATPase [Micromonosporaceae bacterium]